MAEKAGIYKCEICGNVVFVLHAGKGALICCGQPMVLLQPKTEDAGKEKHVPVVTQEAGGVKVKVGSVAHPMEEKHYIEWIAVVAGDNVCLKNLKPGEAPEAEFRCVASVDAAYAFCNLHGLWTA